MNATRLAVFDLDHTLLNGDSDVLWISFLHKKKVVDDAFLEKRDIFFQEYNNANLNLAVFLAFILSPLTQFSRAELESMHNEYMRDYIIPIVYKQAPALIKKHKDNGDDVLIISATNEFLIKPIASYLGIEHCLGIQLEENKQGDFTGDYVGVPSFQAGKITRLESWLQEQNKHFEAYQATYFYSDSVNDIPLLEKVSNPVVVNPDNQLKKVAQNLGWEILLFT